MTNVYESTELTLPNWWTISLISVTCKVLCKI